LGCKSIVFLNFGGTTPRKPGYLFALELEDPSPAPPGSGNRGNMPGLHGYARRACLRNHDSYLCKVYLALKMAYQTKQKDLATKRIFLKNTKQLKI
jgi:hypothetical protein